MPLIVPQFVAVDVADPPALERRTRWRDLPRLLIGAFLAPKRYGPQVARSTWIQTVVAFLAVPIAFAVGLGVVVLAATGHTQVGDYAHNRIPVWFSHGMSSGDDWEPALALSDAHLSAGQLIRLPFAACLNDVHRRTMRKSDPPWGTMVLALAAYCVVVAALVMPFAARHLSGWRRYFRCLKLSLWSIGFIVPLTLLLFIGELCRPSHSFDRLDARSVCLVGAIGYIILAGHVFLIRALGSRPASAAEAALASKVQPRCKACGYVLTGLLLGGRCPECGLAVEGSLSNSDFLAEERLPQADR